MFEEQKEFVVEGDDCGEKSYTQPGSITLGCCRALMDVPVRFLFNYNVFPVSINKSSSSPGKECGGDSSGSETRRPENSHRVLCVCVGVQMFV